MFQRSPASLTQSYLWLLTLSVVSLVETAHVNLLYEWRRGHLLLHELAGKGPASAGGPSAAE